MDKKYLRQFLDRKVDEYNNLSFIPLDPVSIPHLFTKKQDIEIAGFFAATFAWGNRTTIINKCRELMKLMDNSPHDFMVHHKEKDRRRFIGFRHRTFNDTDLIYFLSFLQHHYIKHASLEEAFFPKKIFNEQDPEIEIMEKALNYFYTYFFSLEYVPVRTKKHVASPTKNSGCKRLNMYLRWMIRNDGRGVDFGIWKKANASQLIIPLDVHVARVAKHFKLLTRPNADWQSALELTANLRTFDKNDPVKYDFALFALGIIEKF
jgi:uncharacterized protein (TIGR02757 family)